MSRRWLSARSSRSARSISLFLRLEPLTMGCALSKMHHMPTDLLATIEAADLIGVERSTLSRWVASGRISVAHQLPGKNGAVLFARAEVERVAADYAALEKAK